MKENTHLNFCKVLFLHSRVCVELIKVVILRSIPSMTVLLLTFSWILPHFGSPRLAFYYHKGKGTC